MKNIGAVNNTGSSNGGGGGERKRKEEKKGIAKETCETQIHSETNY